MMVILYEPMVASWFTTGAVLYGAGVMMGAFGAHGLRDRLAVDMLTVFETGVRRWSPTCGAFGQPRYR